MFEWGENRFHIPSLMLFSWKLVRSTVSIVFVAVRSGRALWSNVLNHVAWSVGQLFVDN